MKTYSRTVATAFAMTIAQAGVLFAQDDAKSDATPIKPAKPSRAELKEKQLDVSLEARDIERILGKLKKASELSKQRITEAAKVAEAASTSLDKGDSKAARAEAQQTAEMFQEIVKQLEALLKEEAPQQIAEARQLAQQLAKAEREFAEKFQGALNPTQATSGKGKIDPKSQTKPLTDPDMKMEGNQGKSQKGNGGKDGKQNQDDQNSEKKDADGKQTNDKSGDKPEPNQGGTDQPSDKGTKPSTDGKKGGDKPMPESADGKGEDKEKGKEGGKGKEDKQPGDNEGKKEADGGAGKDKPKDKPGASAGEKQDERKEGDEKQSDGGGSKKEDKDKSKPGNDQDGSGDDKSNDKKRDGSGDGSDGERMNDNSLNERGAPLTAEQLREMAAARADQLAERGKTLQDVLNAIAQSTDPNDKEAVAKVQAITKEIDISKLVAEMGRVSNMIRSKKDDDAKLSSLDAAERLEIMAQRLDGAYRGIVAPQAEELRKLEQALADLRDQLDKLETPSQVAAWHREARELLDRLDKLGVNLKARDEFEEEMKKAGFGVADRVRRDISWGLIDGRYDTPAGYNTALIHIQEDIQERIQALILGDLGNVSDDATPPKYQDLVERYYEVLSRSSSGKSDTSKAKTQMKGTSK